MIQQRKSKKCPPSLMRRKSYKGDDVCEQLFSDHDGKCYLCEARVGCYYEIDHLQSRKHFPERTYDWQNLFLACGSCNNKKKDNFDDLPDPLSTPLEEIIRITPDPATLCERVQVRLLKDIPSGKQLVRLLARVYNGTNPSMRKYREKLFYEGFKCVVASFTEKLLAYRKSPSPDTRRRVVDMLRVDQPFLGAKYSILYESNMLNDFADETRWNRKN